MGRGPGPELREDFDAIVGVDAVTICGTDLHVLAGSEVGVLAGHVRPGDTVVIVGAGPIDWSTRRARRGCSAS